MYVSKIAHSPFYNAYSKNNYREIKIVTPPPLPGEWTDRAGNMLISYLHKIKYIFAFLHLELEKVDI